MGRALQTMVERYVPEICFRMRIRQMLGMALAPAANRPLVPWMGSVPHVSVGKRWEYTPLLLVGDGGLYLHSSKGRTSVGPTLKAIHYWNITPKACGTLTDITTAVLDYGESRRGAAWSRR